MQEPRLLLADEPTSSLDPKTSVEIMELMCGSRASAGSRCSSTCTTSLLAKRFADRVLGMADGRIVFDGPPDQLDDAMLKTIYGGEDWLH